MSTNAGVKIPAKIIPVTMTGLVADMCARVAFDDFLLPKQTFASLAGGDWANVRLSLFEWSVDESDDYLEATLRPKPDSAVEARRNLGALQHILNQPVRAILEDGSALHAEFGNLHQVGMSFGPDGAKYHGRAQLWKWSHGKVDSARIWVGQVEGVAFRIGNLGLKDHRSNRIANGLRLRGNYTWHLVTPDDSATYWAIVDTDVNTLDREIVQADFRALEFSLGHPLKMNKIVGFNKNLEACAGMGLALGSRSWRNCGVSDGPVPDRFETERWRPVLFGKVATYLAKEAKVSIDVPIAAYLDTTTDHLDGAYLKAQVALEAVCAQVVPKAISAVLVRDTKAWLQWVSENEASIRQHAIDAHAAEQLVVKVRRALNAPTTDTVENALGILGLAVPHDIVGEIRERGRVLRRYVMNTTEERDIQKDVYRLDRVKVLLTALVARIVGYDGPITGWERETRSGWPIDPDWWPKCGENREALERFTYDRQDVQEASQGITREY